MAKTIAFLITSLTGGGAEKVVLTLIKSLDRNKYKPVLILNKLEGPYVQSIPDDIQVFELGLSHLRFALPKLIFTLQKVQPSIVVSSLWEVNILAVLARTWGRFSHHLIVCEHSAISRPRGLLTDLIRRWAYKYADIVLGVSKGIGGEIHSLLKIPEEKIKVIYNPVVDELLYAHSREPVEHPWFSDKQVPVVIGMGRLYPEKRFDLLIKAFARVVKAQPARLLLLGDGPERTTLEKQAANLALSDIVGFLGFKPNPFKYLSRSSVFVLSSDYEGLSNVLIEAAACGVPIVSTDCRHGPREILADGKAGLLVPVGNVESLAAGIINVLANQELAQKLSSTAKKQAEMFTVKTAVDKYQRLFDRILEGA